ncbi:hypothetical protein DPMN_114505 [Dreissena polymorpha]|uniref:HIRAN domain-containing protein n=1 Tax=Dreissena polymorpha TaxID=45954 RepID=A0A9D4KL23_DREPO|nr:hypothetical protein DPMN_114505 [Dreissena polymorpha]
MKNAIIRNVYVVGMHHGGKKELEVGALYFCKSEPNNPWDPNAVAVFDDRDLTRRVCYLRREDARKLGEVLGFEQGTCYLRPKMKAEKFSRFKGPMQNCSIGFKCQEDVTRLKPVLNSTYIHKIY